MNIFLWTALTITTLYSAIVTVLLRRHIKAVQSYEMAIASSDADLKDITDRIVATLRVMRHLDDKKMFENDDEVGQVFENLRDLMFDILGTDDMESNE